MKQVRFNNVVQVKYFKKEDIIKTKPKNRKPIKTYSKNELKINRYLWRRKIY